MRRAALVLAALSLVLAACGGEDNDRGTPARGTPAARSGGETPTRAEIEEFGKIKLPASARQIDATMDSALDTGLFLRFVMDRKDVDGFVRDGHFQAKAGYEPTYDYSESGWHLDRIRNTLGAEEFDGNYGRELVIDLDRPDVATVYLVASTV